MTNTADVVRRLMAMQKQVKLLKEWIRLGRPEISLELGDDAAGDVLGLVASLLEDLGRHVENPGGMSMEDWRRMKAKMDQAQGILDRAMQGNPGRPPLLKLESEEEDEEDEDEEDEDAPEGTGARLPSEIDWPKPPSRDDKDDDELIKSAGQDTYAAIRARLQGRITDTELHQFLGLPLKPKRFTDHTSKG